MTLISRKNLPDRNINLKLQGIIAYNKCNIVIVCVGVLYFYYV
jgi:hypothetical protein